MSERRERLRELLALRLYDELDEDERRELEALLVAHPAAAADERDLAAGLGRLRAAAGAGDEDGALPAAWRARLDAALADEPRPARRWSHVLAFAAGLAAGLLLYAAPRLAPDGRGARRPPAPLAVHTNAGAPAPRATLVGGLAPGQAPPPASTRGGLLRLMALDRR